MVEPLVAGSTLDLAWGITPPHAAGRCIAHPPPHALTATWSAAFLLDALEWLLLAFPLVTSGTFYFLHVLTTSHYIIIINVQALYSIFQLFSEEKTWTPLWVSCSSSAPGRPQKSTSSSKAPAEAQTEPYLIPSHPISSHLIPSYRSKCAQICSKWMHGLHMWSLHLHILEIFGPNWLNLKDMLRHLRTLGVFLQHVDSP